MKSDTLSEAARRYRHYMTILFGVSLFFLGLHVVDDALSTGEPAQYGITIPEFLFYAALIYLIIPPLGLVLARRGQVWGAAIMLLYSLQALYGAGLNHVRHMFGDFRGSQTLPALLSALGLHVTDIRGYGFGSVLMGMAGLGQTPPHTHTPISSLIAFTDIGLNAVLFGVTALYLYECRTSRPRLAAVAERDLGPQR